MCCFSRWRALLKLLPMPARQFVIWTRFLPCSCTSNASPSCVPVQISAQQDGRRPAKAARAFLQAPHESRDHDPALAAKKQSSAKSLTGWLDIMTPGKGDKGSMQMGSRNKHEPPEVRACCIHASISWQKLRTHRQGHLSSCKA